MTRVNPRTPINLTWKPEYRPILAELNKRLCIPANRKNALYVARALLVIINDGDTVLTAKDVIDSVYRDDALPNGWPNFDSAKWLNYVPLVVAALKSAKPNSVLNL